MNMTALLDCVLEWVKSTSKSHMKTPDWYHSLALKTWPKTLQSAIGFLAGHFPGKLNIFSNLNVIYRYRNVLFRVAARRFCSFY